MSRGRANITYVALCHARVMRVQNMAYEALIPDHFKPGRRLNVSGEWLDDKAKKLPKELKISLYAGNNIALHFNPRFERKVRAYLAVTTAFIDYCR